MNSAPRGNSDWLLAKATRVELPGGRHARSLSHGLTARYST